LCYLSSMTIFRQAGSQRRGAANPTHPIEPFTLTGGTSAGWATATSLVTPQQMYGICDGVAVATATIESA